MQDLSPFTAPRSREVDNSIFLLAIGRLTTLRDSPLDTILPRILFFSFIFRPCPSLTAEETDKTETVALAVLKRKHNLFPICSSEAVAMSLGLVLLRLELLS